MSDIKPGDGRVFETWAKTECDECACEFQVTRTVSKTIFGPVICDDCALHAFLKEKNDKLTQQVKDLELSLDDRDCYIADADMKNEALTQQVAELRAALTVILTANRDDAGGGFLTSKEVDSSYKALKESE